MKKYLLVTACAVVVCLTVFLLALIAIYGPFFILIANLSEETVVQTLVSPDGSYEARVIDIDSGALGGDTVVEVQKIGVLTKAEQIYVGEWGEYQHMEIYWKDDNCLIINGVEYPIQ